MAFVKGLVAQSVEQRTENPCVDSSILSWPTNKNKGLQLKDCSPFLFTLSFCPAIIPLFSICEANFFLWQDILYPDSIPLKECYRNVKMSPLLQRSYAPSFTEGLYITGGDIIILQ